MIKIQARIKKVCSSPHSVRSGPGSGSPVPAAAETALPSPCPAGGPQSAARPLGTAERTHHTARHLPAVASHHLHDEAALVRVRRGRDGITRLDDPENGRVPSLRIRLKPCHKHTVKHRYTSLRYTPEIIICGLKHWTEQYLHSV